MANADEERFVSLISTLEIARLLYLGLLHLKQSFAEWRTLSLGHLHAAMIPLTHEIAVEAYNLPGNFQKGPIDRVMVATARLERLTLITADDLILRYRHVKTAHASV